jgi:deoxyribonuclease-4
MIMTIRAGVHVSIAGSLDLAVGRAQERGCDCFQIFTKNPRGWAAKEISEDGAEQFRAAVSQSGLSPVFAHMPYLPNLASEKPEIYSKSVNALVSELDRCSLLDIPYLVTHLGHAGDNPVSGQNRVISAINEAVSRHEGRTMLLLENTAGERNSVGSTLEEIGTVLDGIGDRSRAGVCFDTCHAFAAGYEFRNDEAVHHVVTQIEDNIGLSRIHCIHLNDAKGELGSGFDRHEHIGLGSIGERGIRGILHHQSLKKFPFICETPVDERRDDAGNIRMARQLSG